MYALTHVCMYLYYFLAKMGQKFSFWPKIRIFPTASIMTGHQERKVFVLNPVHGGRQGSRQALALSARGLDQTFGFSSFFNPFLRLLTFDLYDFIQGRGGS